MAYSATVAATVRELITQFGHATLRFTDADIDATNFTAFDGAHPQFVGAYLHNGENVFATAQELAASIGAELVMSRAGLLQLIQIALPATGEAVPIGPDDMLENTLAVQYRTEVIAAKVIGYCRNWTVQKDLQTGIAASSVELFASEYLTSTAAAATVKTSHRLTAAPAQENTLLLTEADAVAEAARRLALYSVQRTVFSFEGLPHLLTLKLGQPVTLTNYRFGLAAGKPGMVVSLQPDWITARVKIGVLT